MGNRVLFTLFSSLVLSVTFTKPSLANSSATTKNILEKLLGGGMYDRDLRPDSGNPDATGTVVNINLLINDVERLSEVDMDFTVQMTFRMEWLDTRLAYKNFMGSNKIDYLMLPAHSQSDIWIPDVYFLDEKRSHTHDLMLPNKFVKIYPDGTVLLSSRLTMTVSCPMNYKLYPFDRQTCYIDLRSYGFTTDDIILRWKNYDSVQLTPGLHFSRFELSLLDTSTFDSGPYSCLRMKLQLDRTLTIPLIQIFIPSGMMIIIGWLSFWLDSKSGAGRLILCLVTLLAYTGFVIVLNQHLPLVDYTRGVDIWTGVCIFFLFFSLAECVLVDYFSRKNEEEDEGMRTKSNCVKYDKKPSAFDGFDAWTLSDTIDTVSRVLYPVFFVFFVIIFVYNYKPDYKV